MTSELTPEMPADVRERATSTSMLELRLAANVMRSSVDLQDWLFDRLDVQPGARVLDVGCGNGAQTLEFARRVGPDGMVFAFDISQESVATLKQRVEHGMRVEAVVGDMDDTERIIREDFSGATFDIAHSSYALYYARDPRGVLDAMKKALTPGGRMAVFVPAAPHGLVELARRVSPIPDKVDESLRFGPEILSPYFSANLRDVVVQEFRNVVSIPTTSELIDFYRATTYYDSEAEPAISDAVDAVIASEGVFRYEKNGFLIVGALAA